MKAAVMESNNGKSVILTDDGVFVEIEGSYEPGQVIEYSKWQPVEKAKKTLIRNIAVAACLVMALLIGGSTLAGPETFATVELGDEYGVRYLLDEDLKVIDVQESEDGGRELADKLDSGGVKGKDINEAITMAEEFTGISYDAANKPPEVKCKNDSESSAIADDIFEHHSENRQEPDNAENKASADRPAVEPDSGTDKSDVNVKETPDPSPEGNLNTKAEMEPMRPEGPR